MSSDWETTPNLSLPLVMPSQAQPNVTHNEAIARLDTVVQLAALDRDLSAPPAEPRDGDRHIVAAEATGVWAGQDGNIAAYFAGGWEFITPRPGWRCWLVDEEMLVVWTGGHWAAAGEGGSGSPEFSMLGIGTSASSEQPFAARLESAFWTAPYEADGGGGDLRLQLNKEDSSNVVSFIFQTDWSGRAEIGLAGNDDLSLRVSSDGETWKDALVIDRATGAVAMPFTAPGGGDGLPAGAVGIFAMSTPPAGWLEMDGSVVSRSTYAALFAAIGTTYGAGDGSTTFALPDARGLALRGWDNGRGIDTGRSFGSYQAHKTEGLAAKINASSTEIYLRETALGWIATSYASGISRSTASSGRSSAIEVAATGDGETAMVNLALLFCIKV